MDPAQQNKRLRFKPEVIKRENIQLRIERDDARQENRAAKLVIEYFRTHNPPKGVLPGWIRDPLIICSKPEILFEFWKKGKD